MCGIARPLYRDPGDSTLDFTEVIGRQFNGNRIDVLLQARKLRGPRKMQSHEAYKAFPAKVAQQVLKLLDGTGNPFSRCPFYQAGWQALLDQLDISYLHYPRYWLATSA